MTRTIATNADRHCCFAISVAVWDWAVAVRIAEG